MRKTFFLSSLLCLIVLASCSSPIKAPVVSAPKDGEAGKTFILAGKAEPGTEIWWLSYNESCLSKKAWEFGWSGGQQIPVDATGNFSTNLGTDWFSNTRPNEILVLSVYKGRNPENYSGENGDCFPSEYVTGPIEINYTGELRGMINN